MMLSGRVRLSLLALVLASLLAAPFVLAGSGNSVDAAAFHLDGSPVETATLNFTVPKTPRPVTAELRVFALSPSTKGYVVHSPAGSAHAASFKANTWTTVDVTQLVGAPGKLALLLTDPTPTAIKFAGATSANPPVLLLLARGTTRVVARLSPGGKSLPAPSSVTGKAEQGQLVGGTSALVAAAGDIACDPTSPGFTSRDSSQCQQVATSNLLLSIHHLAGVLPLGDDQYECGRADAFAKSYAPSWGRLRKITHPVPGNHEYGRPCHVNDATPYFDYFGTAAGPFGKGWYSYDLAKWHLVALDSECGYGTGQTTVGGCNTGSPQERWLRRDLASHKNVCTLAYWHEPRFSSGEHGDAIGMTAIWNDLAAAHADVVLSGHNHDYERFAPLGRTTVPPASKNSTTTGTPIYQQPALSPTGITEFIVGTGGKNHYDFTPSHSEQTTTPLTGEKIRNDSAFGVLELNLLPKSFTWSFVTIGHRVLDSGSAPCH